MVDRLGRRAEAGRAARPGRRRLARPAHADHVAAAAGRRGRATTSSTRARGARYLDRDAHPHRRALRADRRPLRALAARGGRHRVVDGAGRSSASWSARRSPRCARRPRPRACGCRPSCPTTLALARGEPREGAARPVQPDPERDPPHARRTAASPCAREPARRRGRGRGRRHRRGDRRRPTATACSTPFFRGGAEARAREAAPASAWRSPARSSRPTAGGSGSTMRMWGRGSGSLCRPRRVRSSRARAPRPLRSPPANGGDEGVSAGRVATKCASRDELGGWSRSVDDCGRYRHPNVPRTPVRQVRFAQKLRSRRDPTSFVAAVRRNRRGVAKERTPNYPSPTASSASSAVT